MDIKTISSLGRFKDIIIIFFKYGFGDLVERLDLPVGENAKETRRANPDLGTYERIRMALEELGPTFVKFGQIMSVRPDLLPAQLIRELSRLQDEVAPIDFPSVQNIIEKNLERPLAEVFPVFDKEPLAAASLSQVHRAMLDKEGPVVAVKVQRPGLRYRIERDFDIITVIADRIQNRFEELAVYDLPGLVRLCRYILTRELDFTKEARYMRIARSHASLKAEIYVPMVYGDYCAKELLVTEFIHGKKLKEIDLSVLPNAEILAKKGLRAGIKQILEDGFFHADPHPGNILITGENEICMVDWGMVGRLTVGERYELIDLIHSVVEKDSERLTEAVIKIAVRKENELDIDRRSMEKDLLDILDLYFSIPIKELNLGQMLLDITQTMKKHRLIIPTDLAIMIKSLVTLEGIARHIYPDLDVIAEARPYVRNIMAQRFTPKLLWEKVFLTFSHILAIQGEIPKRLDHIVRKLEEGDLSIRFEHENLDELRYTLENISNRLTFGIIIGAIVIGSSMIITTGVPPLLFGYPALGVIGYLVSGILGLWLVFNIIRRRRY